MAKRGGMKMVLSALFLALCLRPCLQADRVYESSTLTGWTEDRSEKPVHYAVHILYNPPEHRQPRLSSGGIKSIVAQYGDRTVVFPPRAFNDCSRDWGTPSYFGYSVYGKCYQLSFFNCGDAAKSYMVDFQMCDGRLQGRQIIPAQFSEVNDSLLRFDRSGKVVYNGPCDRQGRPTRLTESKH